MMLEIVSSIIYLSKEATLREEKFSNINNNSHNPIGDIYRKTGITVIRLISNPYSLIRILKINKNKPADPTIYKLNRINFFHSLIPKGILIRIMVQKRIIFTRIFKSLAFHKIKINPVHKNLKMKLMTM